jgi:hypothetical protein
VRAVIMYVVDIAGERGGKAVIDFQHRYELILGLELQRMWRAGQNGHATAFERGSVYL